MRLLPQKPKVQPPIGRITDAWNMYRKNVMHKWAPPLQRQECRRAFYAGAEAAMTASAILAGLEEKEGTQGLLEIEAELLRFIEQVKAGEA